MRRHISCYLKVLQRNSIIFFIILFYYFTYFIAPYKFAVNLKIKFHKYFIYRLAIKFFIKIKKRISGFSKHYTI
jgi:hypothetical protein